MWVGLARSGSVWVRAENDITNMGMCMGAYTNVSCVVYSIPEQKLGFSVKDFCCKKRVLEILDALFKAKHKIKKLCPN